ncbi:hypothetical protein DRI50_03590 [candidate division KSB1 bacterium]|nr:MAG: hypothetical protein DRI50_03590 [candidate division KSB1 bacterium]
MKIGIKGKIGLVALLALFLFACATSIQRARYFDTVVQDVAQNNFDLALKKIQEARKNHFYGENDRLLYYLDLGSIYHYKHDYPQSNVNFDRAEQTMDELFTKSISQMALSYIMNDNSVAYAGEIYENLYVNVFKALNYAQLNRFDDAFAEIKRVDIKLRELEDRYQKAFEEFNRKDTTGVKVHYQPVHFYNDALAHYLSYLIYRADQRYDDSRIEIEKLHQAWQTHSDIYYFSMPSSLQKPSAPDKNYLNIIGFVGKAPYKIAVGGLITTYNGYLGISDLSVPLALPRIPFPGLKAGYHFKFAFPVMRPGHTQINRIDVFIDGQKAGELELLEDMGKVALKTFRNKQQMIYIKTLVRTVTKGILAAKGKKKLRKKLKANAFWGAVLDAGIDLSVDDTEQPDLRCWKTLPDECLIGEFPVEAGQHTVDISCYSNNGSLVYQKRFARVPVKQGLNLIDFATLR